MKNEFLFSEDKMICTIFFNDKTSFVIDSSDFQLVSKYTWFKGKRGYPTAHYSRKLKASSRTFTLHRLLFGFPESGDIDHIDGNKMNNRRENMRLCSHQQNMFNQKKRCTNSTGYTGVSFSKSAKKYEAYIHHNGKKKNLGLYRTAVEAAIARDKAALEYFGEYARLNLPMDVIAA